MLRPLIVAVLLLCATPGVLAEDFQSKEQQDREEDEALIGWKGETFKPLKLTTNEEVSVLNQRLSQAKELLSKAEADAQNAAAALVEAKTEAERVNSELKVAKAKAEADTLRAELAKSQTRVASLESELSSQIASNKKMDQEDSLKKKAKHPPSRSSEWAPSLQEQRSIQENAGPNAHTGKDTNERLKPWIQTISWKPRAFVYHNFLSHQEAAHIISLASPQMKRSQVVGGPNSSKVNDIRTSAGMFLDRNQDSVITAVEERLAVWSQLPPSHQEGMQVLRYGPSNKYGPHQDGLGRVISVLIYLVEPEEGGETAFVKSDGWLHKEMSTQQGNLSSCAQGHVAYKPKVGDALMFYDVQPMYTEDDVFSMHTGCPVLKGVKWNAVKWIHGISYPDNGECEKNPDYMTGSNRGAGDCRNACKICQKCDSPDDLKCIRANRQKIGFANYDPEEYGILKDLVVGEIERSKEEFRKEYQATV
eukprot:gene21599-28598_t